MIIGKIEQAIVMEIYGEDGQFLSKQTKYIYKPVLIWRDLIIGILIALFIGSQVMV
jgi:hypothetical protein